MNERWIVENVMVLIPNIDWLLLIIVLLMVNHVPEPQNISKHSKTLENITQVDNHSPEILGSALKSWQ